MLIWLWQKGGLTKKNKNILKFSVDMDDNYVILKHVD
jgi:hypothetical protein